MSWSFNNNNNASTNTNNAFNWGNTANTNTNNNTTNNNMFNWGGNTNNNTMSNNPNASQQSQFVTGKSKFSSLPDEKKKIFVDFEKNVIEKTTAKQDELHQTIEKLEKLPDISHSLQMYRDQTLLLTEKINCYKHDLEPFTNKLKKEFVYASQVQVDVQRQSSMSMQSLQSESLPPPFYWDKVAQFQQQLTDLRKQLEDLQQHLNDQMNSDQTNEVINTKTITNALNATHRSTLNIAANVITNHNMIQKLKEQYKKFRYQHFGDSYDPFQERTPRKIAVSKIEQFVSKGIEMNGLQSINYNMNGNNNMNQPQNNQNNPNANANANQNNSTFNWGTNSNQNNNNTNANNSGFNFGASSNNNAGTGGTNSGWSWGNSNASNNNNNASDNKTNSSNQWTFRSNSFAR